MGLWPSISFPVWITSRRSRLCSRGSTWSIVNAIALIPVRAVWSHFPLGIRSRFPGPRVGTWWAASFFAKVCWWSCIFNRIFWGFSVLFELGFSWLVLCLSSCWELVMIIDFIQNPFCCRFGMIMFLIRSLWNTRKINIGWLSWASILTFLEVVHSSRMELITTFTLFRRSFFTYLFIEFIYLYIW